MNKIIILLLGIIVSACSNGACGSGQDNGSTPAANLVEIDAALPSITSVQFCENVKGGLCTRTAACGVATMEECIITITMQFPPCEQWTPENICPEGSTYNGELAYKCMEPLNSMTCDQENVPVECQTKSYCLLN